MTADIHISKHEAKLEDIDSINLWCECDPELRADPGSVCHKCYWYTRHRVCYHNLNDAMKRNLKVFNKLIPIDEMPWMNAAYFRYSSFGDISKLVHARNFIALAAANKHCNFGWWTKRPELIEKAVLKDNYWPGNLVLNVSAKYLNKPMKYVPCFADRQFVVWTKDKIPKQKQINKEVEYICKKQCKDCLVCYTKNNIKIVHEELK